MLVSGCRGHKIFMSQLLHEATLTEKMFKPLVELYMLSNYQRDCPGLSDLEYLKMGVERCVSSAQSGHEFLQNYRKSDGDLKDRVDDELSSIEELKKWHVLAGDGHYQKAAIFDPKTKAQTSRKGPSKSPTGHFFKLNLRNHHLDYLDLAQPDDGKKSEHDMKMLKRQELSELRDDAPKGTKVLWLWDRAVIDYHFWLTAKNQKGVYFVTLEKSNSVTKFIREHTVIDYDDKRNEGIISI